jgi:hypothetical protein
VQSERESYLADGAVDGFITYFVDVVNGKKTIDHHYSVEPKAWIAALKKRGIGKVLSLPSFQDAFNEYFWMTPEQERASGDDPTDEPAGNRRGTTYEQNATVLNALSCDLIGAIKDKRKEVAFRQCIKILDWGQVYRGAVGWVVKQHEEDQLISCLIEGRDILEGDSLTAVSAFGNGRLRMDSGLTKIYSLSSTRSIIYDDRVGAALGLLVQQFLEHDGKKHCLKAPKKPGNRRGIVPDKLRFMRSGRKDRNPSRGMLSFPSRGSKASLNHARANVMANWILGAVSDRVSKIWDIRKLEATLFMIGYRVSETESQSVETQN